RTLHSSPTRPPAPDDWPLTTDHRPLPLTAAKPKQFAPGGTACQFPASLRPSDHHSGTQTGTALKCSWTARRRPRLSVGCTSFKSNSSFQSAKMYQPSNPAPLLGEPERSLPAILSLCQRIVASWRLLASRNRQ